MSERRRILSRPNKLRIFLFLNVVALLFLVIAFGREYVGNIQIEREIQQYEEERAALEQDRLDTLDLIDELSSEEYLEREARTKHGLAENGETLIVIQDQVGEEDPFALPEEELVTVTNPTRWFYYFFDKEAFDSLSL